MTLFALVGGFVCLILVLIRLEIDAIREDTEVGRLLAQQERIQRQFMAEINNQENAQ